MSTDSAIDSGMSAPTPHEMFDALGVVVTHHFDRLDGYAYAKLTHIPAGVTLEQHSHPHPHTSYLLSGAVQVDADGMEPALLEGFNVLTIPANVAHSVTALADAVWVCAWNTRCIDPAKVDAALMAP